MILKKGDLKMNMEMRLWDLYCGWLVSEYPEEIKSGDDLDIAIEEHRHYDEFVKAVKESLGVWDA